MTTRLSIRARIVGVLVVGMLSVPGLRSTAAAEPSMTLRLPAFQNAVFPNGSSIVLPSSGHGDVEVWLQDALAEIQVSTVRIRLNEVPMATFTTINRLPRGVRAIVKMGLSINADFSFRPGRENLLTFSATDASSVTYQAQFYVSLSPEAEVPRLAAQAPVRTPQREVVAPPQVFPPTIAFTVNWAEKTPDRILTLDAEVSDREGLRRVVLEVNGRVVEEVVLENELPVRKQRGFIARSRLPGSVTGDGRRVTVSIPVSLDRRLNTVALRAENVSGLIGYADRTVEVTSIR